MSSSFLEWRPGPSGGRRVCRFCGSLPSSPCPHSARCMLGRRLGLSEPELAAFVAGLAGLRFALPWAWAWSASVCPWGGRLWRRCRWRKVRRVQWGRR